MFDADDVVVVVDDNLEIWISPCQGIYPIPQTPRVCLVFDLNSSFFPRDLKPVAILRVRDSMIVKCSRAELNETKKNKK